MNEASEEGSLPAVAYGHALVNILEDLTAEKVHLWNTQMAELNILEDLSADKALLEQAQAVVLRSEKAARISLREKEVLLKEIHHRVKNNLQVISSLLNLQARYLVDPGAREIFRDSQNRVQSIALVHERLYESADLSHLNFRTYMISLLDSLFDTYNIVGHGITKDIKVDIGDASFPIDVAVPCGLIINELVTNALKHAFPGERQGTVSVVLGETARGELDLTVSDDGVGIPAGIDPRNTASLGLELVFTFAQQLNADVEIQRHAGTSFRFRFPKVSA